MGQILYKHKDAAVLRLQFASKKLVSKLKLTEKKEKLKIDGRYFSQPHFIYYTSTVTTLHMIDIHTCTCMKLTV